MAKQHQQQQKSNLTASTQKNNPQPQKTQNTNKNGAKKRPLANTDTESIKNQQHNISPQHDNKNNKEEPLKVLCKQTGYDWYNSIQQPRFVLSPMVGQSELAYRLLCRKHGAQLTYTPMIIASQFVSDTKYRKAVWQFSPEDRPLVVQFCANDPVTFVKAAKLVLDQCDAVELNLGCPQDVAKRGGYGSWMMEQQTLIQEILTYAAKNLDKPITAKIRVFGNFQDTLSYVQMLQNCGISLLTIHPRQRHHREEVLADWDIVRLLRQHLHIPLVLNGDMWGPSDVAMAMCLVPTDGYMCAQGALQMPAIFETVSKYSSYNRPNGPGASPLDQSTDVNQNNNKKQKTSQQSSMPKVSLGNNNNNNNNNVNGTSQFDEKIPLNDNLTFISTLDEPFTNPNNTAYFRQRKYLGTGFGPNAKNTKPDNTNNNNPTSVVTAAQQEDTRVEAEYAKLTSEQQAEYHKTILKYPLTPIQRQIFNKNPTNIKFLSLVLHHEQQIDQCKRQLQNAVEYLRIIETPNAAVYHHSVAQRHFFFILFDLLQKHIDAYDKLYVAKDPVHYKEVIMMLHKKAIINADFAGINVKESYFALNHKERPRRRDGTLAPPPWPVGGGGFNTANSNNGNANSAAIKATREEEAKQRLLKNVDLSKFD